MSPRFVVVASRPEPCPYLPGETAVMPLRQPLRPLAPEEFDLLLAEGDRRAGPFLYRVKCPACTACTPLRIPIARFQESASHRKLRRRNRDVVVEFVPPEVTDRHLEIYNAHKRTRGLARREEDTDAETFRLNLVVSSVPTVEVRYTVEGKLVAFSILDLGRSAASSVYHCFDPEESWRSLGVFSVLAELDACRRLGRELYYLGLWVEGCRALAYKASWFPHEKRLGGKWIPFERPPADPA